MDGLILSFDFVDIGGCMSPLKVEAFGLQVVVVREELEGFPMGSIAVQAVIGTRDSRLVVKLGELKCGMEEVGQQLTSDSFSATTTSGFVFAGLSFNLR